MDLYVFATPYRITWDYYFSARDHTLNFDSWEEKAELEYVGFSICVFFFYSLKRLSSFVFVVIYYVVL